jgi:hypothetical protein
MPTGYTSEITADTTLEEFALKCARAFGALITMRDDPNDAPIPEFKPSVYHVDRIVAAKERISALSAMTPQQCEAEIDKEASARARERANSKAESDAKRSAYEAVLAKVHAWTPPTEDHKGLKAFMIEQITESIRFDCHDDEFLDRVYPMTRKTVAEWHAAAMESARHDLAYHTSENAAEIARVESRNKWVRDLRNSLRK